jgi:hypothetical protein
MYNHTSNIKFYSILRNNFTFSFIAIIIIIEKYNNCIEIFLGFIKFNNNCY